MPLPRTLIREAPAAGGMHRGFGFRLGGTSDGGEPITSLCCTPPCAFSAIQVDLNLVPFCRPSLATLNHFGTGEISRDDFGGEWYQPRASGPGFFYFASPSMRRPAWAWSPVPNEK